MEATETLVRVENSAYCSAQPRCPICGGGLVQLRDEYRCCQCFFRICDGCDGAREPDG